MTKQRIIGFDLARAYALLGMFIVNFNYCFGSVFPTTEPVGRFLNLFTGNSTAIFIILAGMGMSLMIHKKEVNVETKKTLRSIILKRSWFLLALGLLLFTWWPGDILHFYGSYMHIAAFLLFVPKHNYLWIAGGVIVIYHLLLFVIPVETSWNMMTFEYANFWSPTGFIRNTFYNGWNSVFPWFAYFLLGMWLGKLDWQNRSIRRNVFLTGFIFFMIFQGIRLIATKYLLDSIFHNYIVSEYFPPYLPFIVITACFGLMVISICMLIGEKCSANMLVSSLVKTGQMTLSHYVIHLTLGMIILAALTGKHYTGFLEDEIPTSPLYILIYAISFFIASILFSSVWAKKFKNGPLETLMRKISG
ncbi:MAG: DUF418 domain-containing protein [Bacteroidota bacterium]